MGYAPDQRHRCQASLQLRLQTKHGLPDALGLGLVVLTIRRLLRRKPAPATAEAQAEIDPAMLEKIEKDLAKLD